MSSTQSCKARLLEKRSKNKTNLRLVEILATFLRKQSLLEGMGRVVEWSFGSLDGETNAKLCI